MIGSSEEQAAFWCGNTINPTRMCVSNEILARARFDTYAFNRPLKLRVLPSLFSFDSLSVLTVGTPVLFPSRDVERVKEASRSSSNRMHRAGIRPIRPASMLSLIL